MRTAAERERQQADAHVTAARQASRELAKRFESLVDTVLRDELARAEQRMRVEALASRPSTNSV